VSKNEYIWNILMMGTTFFLNIPMSRKKDVENIFHMYLDENQKMDEMFK
jgi:hypothetical protein